jgi:hypothetical protein
MRFSTSVNTRERGGSSGCEAIFVGSLYPKKVVEVFEG